MGEVEDTKLVLSVVNFDKPVKKKNKGKNTINGIMQNDNTCINRIYRMLFAETIFYERHQQ